MHDQAQHADSIIALIGRQFADFLVVGLYCLGSKMRVLNMLSLHGDEVSWYSSEHGAWSYITIHGEEI
jgi:hypothetical protein